MTPDLDKQIAFIKAQIALCQANPIYVVNGGENERLPGTEDKQLATLKAVLDTLMFVKFNQPNLKHVANNSVDFILAWFNCPKFPQCGAPAGTICPGCPGKSRSLRHLLECDADA